MLDILKFVNGAATKNQRRRINTEMYQYEVFYRTTKNVRKGTELLMCYGPDFVF